MKLALALEFPLMQQGGTEVLVRELIRGLRPHFDIVLVSGDSQLRDLPDEFANLISRQFSWNLRSGSADTARALAQALRDEKIDLAHFHFGGTYQWRTNRFWQCPIYYLGKLGVPCLSTNHLAEEWLNCGVNPIRPLWQKYFYQFFALFSRSMVYRQLKVEVCVSKGDQRRVAGQFPLSRRKIIQRYHSLLSADTPPPNLTDRDPVIICVGTIGGRKAQPNLAEAFARIADKHPKWELHFIGRSDSPDYVQRIQKSATAVGASDRVRVLGRLTDEETANRMQRASIIGMPSLQEGLGLSLQEALFHGCVAIGSRVGGIPELIEHEVNGLLVPPGDIEALSGQLNRVLSDPELLSRLRTQTRESILRKGMTASAMIAHYRRLYEEILKRS
jgi:glycosyltransferase involved in cell wall biosynthesis